MKAQYPFIPKSTAYLEPGQFFSIALSNGRYACGRILQFRVEGDKRDLRTILIGLMDWCGSSKPTSEAIAGAGLLEHGRAHIKTVRECGGEILGHRPLEADGIEIPLTLDESPGPNCRLRRGFDLLGYASSEQQRSLEVFSTWGYRIIQISAEKYFCERV